MKYVYRVVGLVISALFMMSTICYPNLVYADSVSEVEPYDQEEMEEAYSNVIEYAEKNEIRIGMTFDDFISNYNGQEAYELEQVFCYTMNENGSDAETRSSGGSDYYYNTETCPEEADYSKYNLLDIVKKGDIVYEANGFYGLTGHIAIVAGILTDANGKEYIRIIEAIPDGGVVRSILDDTRVEEQAVTILRVEGATTVIKNRAVNFCVNQLGESYNLDFAKDSSASETDWYCSELVWAAYYNEGLNIEVAGNGEPGVTPRDRLNSSITTAVPYDT